MGICKKDCSKCILKSKCGGCSLCEASLCNNNCSNCSSICPKRKGSFSYLSSLGGINFKLKSNSSLTSFNFPTHILIIPDKTNKQFSYKYLPIVGVHGGNMFSSNGESISKRYNNKGFHRVLNLNDKTKGILEFYVKDRTLEGFWDNRESIYDSLKKMNFYAVISPNFSVYEDAPRVDHMYNMKRSSIVYNEMIEEGINAIPDISWYNIEDLKRWAMAINESNISIISFSFQVVGVNLKASNIWRHYLSGFRWICENISKNIKIIVAGVASKRRVSDVINCSCGQNIHILNQSAFVQSRRGTLSETREQKTSISFDSLFFQNLSYFNKTYSSLKNNI